MTSLSASNQTDMEVQGLNQLAKELSSTVALTHSSSWCLAPLMPDCPHDTPEMVVPRDRTQLSENQDKSTLVGSLGSEPALSSLSLTAICRGGFAAVERRPILGVLE